MNRRTRRKRKKSNKLFMLEEKNMPKPPCDRYSHIPPDNLCFSQVNPTYGTPNDGGETLLGYKHSWDAKIYATKDHKDAVRLIRRQKASKWDISLECDEFQTKVKECVLWRAIE
ncbi:hypothetical protein C5167_011973 [Papaver somniferum]|uniref:Uncharacterized protein n=2 Tax=Papaver somniferum TaxID=3469 RepID=A0A4Y7IZJ2_PAPSO|nr:hypothetical protein C5167_011973 [Papaver somniferum]